MTNPIRLAVATTARGAQIDATRGGGLSDIPPEMLGFALAGCDKRCALAFRAAWCGENSSALIDDYLLKKAKALAKRENWRADKRRLRLLCKLALTEFIDLDKYKTHTKRALFFGVTPQCWGQTWSKRYQAIYSYLPDWEAAAWHHANKRINGE